MTRLSEQLRTRCQSTWDRAVDHRLFREIATDQVDDAVFRRYLTIEYGFIDTAAAVMGFAVAKAPDLAVRRHLSAGLHGLTSEQVAFFEQALGKGAEPIRPHRAAGLHEHFLGVARDGSYVDIIACMLAAEWLYATWCQAAHATPSSRRTIAAWVALHAAAPFVDQVTWMRDQLDAFGYNVARESDIKRLAAIFEKAIAQEILFHDAAYELAA